jgi:hypothetical protein
MGSALFFRLYGGLALSFHALSLVITALRADSHPLTSRAVIGICVSTFCVLAVSGGLFRLRKWAAVLFSAGSGLVWVLLVVGSLLYAPLPWMLLTLGSSVVFLLPPIGTYLFWSDLSGGV